jgi:hypothetical protein
MKPMALMCPFASLSSALERASVVVVVLAVVGMVMVIPPVVEVIPAVVAVVSEELGATLAVVVDPGATVGAVVVVSSPPPMLHPVAKTSTSTNNAGTLSAARYLDLRTRIPLMMPPLW